MIAQVGRASIGEPDRSGRPHATSGAERARVSVTRALRAALQRIGEHHPALAEHLDATVHTGVSCSYRPDPRLAVRWDP